MAQQGDSSAQSLSSGMQKAASAGKDAVHAAMTTAHIAKGVAAGGVGGLVEAGKEFIKNPKQFVKSVVIVLVIFPVLVILTIIMLPLIIFGSIAVAVVGILEAIGNFFRNLPIIGSIIAGIAGLFGGGADATPQQVYDYQLPAYIAFDNHFDTANLLYNLEQAHVIIGESIQGHYISIITDGQSAFNSRSNPDVSDRLQIIGTDGYQVFFDGGDGEPLIGETEFFRDTAMVMGMYAASRHYDVLVISLDDLRAAMEGVGDVAALFDIEVEILDGYEEYFFRPTIESHGELYESEYPFWCYERELYVYYTYTNFFWHSESGQWIPLGAPVLFWSETWEQYVSIPIRFEASGIYVDFLEMPVNLHQTIITAGSYDAFGKHFGIYGDARKMAYAMEFTDNLMMLLTDTDLGGWFGIILEAGIVEGFYSPFPGTNWRISSPFGMRMHPIRNVMAMHYGIDIPKPTGTPIRAIADGVVTMSGWSGAAGGNRVRIDHGYIPGFGNVQSAYFHNSRNRVVVGQQVVAGQHIADVGSTGQSTGPHLHLEIFVNSIQVNPVGFIGPPPG